MDENSVTAEVHKLIDNKISSGVVVNIDWAAAEILAGKAEIDGADAPFYRVCTFKEVQRIVRRAIGKYDVTDTTDDQLVLPGFKHLCKAYAITRDGKVMLVPVTKCTTPELLARADFLDEMAKGCRSHAREIREYVSARAAEAA